MRRHLVTSCGSEACFRSGIQRELADSGAWVFRGTRVPVKALFENLEGGARIDDFLSWFPGVSREMAEAVLEHASQATV